MSAQREPLKLRTLNFDITIWGPENRGYFEHHELGDNCAGELVFEDGELYDYDGVFELPKEVVKAVETAGFFVDEMFK